uniref:Uncharacterized protein n=1 Tax=Glossina austeni TaxID=7395 RepID=A0A1A9VCD8_GLOAU
MQRSIYTITKPTPNDLGYRTATSSKRTVATTNDHALPTMVRNRNFAEILANKQTRRRKKKIDAQTLLNNMQSCRLSPPSPSNSTIKKFEQKNFIRENIANVAGISSQIKYRNWNRDNVGGGVLKKSPKDVKDDINSFINTKIGERDVHLSWPQGVASRGKRPSPNALSLYEFYKNTWSNCHIPGETSIRFVNSKINFKDGYYFNQ